jgi:PiT family inorganic phosphate transporter
MGAGVYVGWNIGANDTANCIGTTLGAGLLTFKKAVILVSFFAILGAVFQGQPVMKTIGEGIIKENLNFLAIFIALICSGFFVTFATFLRIPTSTSQAVVGGVLGIGLSGGSEVNYLKLLEIAGSWILCPVIVMAFSFFLSHLLGFVSRRVKTSVFLVQNMIGWLTILSGCYVAFSMGANNVGSAVGPVANLRIIHPVILLGIGGIAIALGAITYGEKVAVTVGKGIIPLDISGAFASQISCAVGIHIFSIFGMPISTSAAIVGAVLGTGLSRGTMAISKKTVLTIFVGWILTPFLSASSSFLMYKALSAIIG